MIPVNLITMKNHRMNIIHYSLLICITLTWNVNAGQYIEFFSTWSKFNARNRAEAFSSTIPDVLPTLLVKKPLMFLSDIQGTIPQEIYDLQKAINGDPFFTGVPLPKGILLVGPSGTGKTTMVRALADESGIPCIAVAASEFVNKWVGQGAENVRKVFEEARALIKKGALYVIIFIDEIDAIGNRDEIMGGDTETRRTINELLNQMDGFKVDSKIIVFGATNHVDLVDPALRRPGRFDAIIEVKLPDLKSRTDILNHYLYNPKYNRSVQSGVSIAVIASSTNGYSGAELKNIIEKAAINAARNQRTSITQADLDTAFNESRAAHSLR